MRVLVLGGTGWLGSAVAVAAVEAGHDVTCLARGESGSFPAGCRWVRGDRTAPRGYAGLGAGRWDLVVDVTRQPGQVSSALDALSEQADHWVFVSSGSVYADRSVVGAGLNTPLLQPWPHDEEGFAHYGERKVACEDLVRGHRGSAALVARSGIIAGYGDPTDRFGYWVGRLALAALDGGPVLVPCDQPVQVVDVADLAQWLVRAGLAGTTGTVDAFGPRRTMGDVLRAASDVSHSSAQTVTAGNQALFEAGVQEFMGPRSLALWLADPAWAGFMARDPTSARLAGLICRPLETTTQAALAWERRLGLDRTGRAAGLDRSDELALLHREAIRPAR